MRANRERSDTRLDQERSVSDLETDTAGDRQELLNRALAEAEAARLEERQDIADTRQESRDDEVDARQESRDDQSNARQSAQQDEVDARQSARDDEVDARQSARNDEADARFQAQQEEEDAQQEAVFEREDAQQEAEFERADVQQEAEFERADAQQDALFALEDLQQEALFNQAVLHIETLGNLMIASREGVEDQAIRGLVERLGYEVEANNSLEETRDRYHIARLNDIRLLVSDINAATNSLGGIASAVSEASSFIDASLADLMLFRRDRENAAPAESSTQPPMLNAQITVAFPDGVTKDLGNQIVDLQVDRRLGGTP